MRSVPVFQLTRLMRGVTKAYDIKCSVVNISTHTPHARRDLRLLIRGSIALLFQLTRLMRGVT